MAWVSVDYVIKSQYLGTEKIIEHLVFTLGEQGPSQLFKGNKETGMRCCYLS